MQFTIKNTDKKKKYVIMPKEKLADWSFRMKYYSVESEKIFGDIIVTQQSLENLYLFPSIYISKGINQILKTFEPPDLMTLSKLTLRDKMKHHNKFISLSGDLLSKKFNCSDDNDSHGQLEKKQRIYPPPLMNKSNDEVLVSSLVDKLLLDIYRYPKNGCLSFTNQSTVSSIQFYPKRYRLQKVRLQLKTVEELKVVLETLQTHINLSSGLLIRQLRKRDYLWTKRDKQYDVITAHLQAYSDKRIEDTRMRFSLSPGGGGFTQWLDAMKMVVKLPGGIPHEFRKKLWLTLAERHLEQRGIDWNQAEKICFNEWINPDDEELGIQIVKDLHRTGCSLFCGVAGRDNQAVLRRVLLGFARWNKSVGYCQGLNVLAALVLQVTDRAEASAVKVMIYLVEGVLPEGYFADNLRGLSVDMAVFRDLLRMRLPRLSKHLEALQSDTKDKPTGSSYEPPLTNVFTMQWFLTLFCHCLPQDAVLRVWDLIFLEGDEVLLKTALAIWEGISDRIMTVTSADEFYSIMGVLTREMLEFTDTNNLIKTIVSMGSLSGVTDLREKHRYNITPWARRLSDDEDTDTEDEERIAVAAAMFGVAHRFKKDRRAPGGNNLQINPTSDREKLALDISTLKHQYAKLRERQRQAHVILSAACARQSIVPTSTTQAMNHLLVGKSALISSKTRQLGPPPGSVPPKSRNLYSSRNQIRRDKQDATLHWKDMKKLKETKNEPAVTDEDELNSLRSIEDMSINHKSSRRNSADSESDSTSTELCDEPDYLSDSEDLTSNSDYNSSVIDCEKHSNDNNGSSVLGKDLLSPNSKDNIDIDAIAKITDQIRRLSASDDITTEKLSIVSKEEKDEDKNLTVSDILISPTVDSSKFSKDDSNLERININETYKDDNPISLTNNEIYNVDKQLEIDDELELLNNIKSRKKDNCDLAGHYSFSFDSNTSVSKVDSFNKISINDRSNTIDYPSTFCTDSLNNEIIEDKSYRKSYVVGHLPIVSPTIDKKFDKQSNDSKDISDFEIDINDKDIDDVPTIYDIKRLSTSDSDYTLSLYKYDKKVSPQTPSDISKSLTSGETLGPDSKLSSVASSNHSTMELKLSKYSIDDEKSDNSSNSSNLKTMTLDVSLELDNDTLKSNAKLNSNKILFDKSTPSSPISTDSLKNKSELTSPSKLVVSSSCESYNSSNKLKYSEKSFSSGLQSPISANSIKYTVNYRGQDNYSESPNISSLTSSPFYPINNQKSPSPNNRNNVNKDKELNKDKDNINTTDDLYDNKYNKVNNYDKFSKYNVDDDYDSGRPFEAELAATLSSTKKLRNENDKSTVQLKLTTDEFIKPLYSDDLSPLTNDKIDNFKPSINISCDNDQSYDGNVVNDIDNGLLKCNKLFERSSTSLDNRLNDMKLSVSIDDFAANKKRSSDILADLRHLEANSNDGIPVTSVMMTRKTGYELEDLKDLEARRQDAFSDSAVEFTTKSSFKKIDIPCINLTNDGRKKGYIVEPKIQIDENSDSILKNYTKIKNNCSDNQDDDVSGDEDTESKVGVWTKVKPKKRNENGRRSSSDRALKIIQENSAILHKILACQAKKCLPDLEEISKEITISPINEEISKIFSPILEKMGLNEKEINEELAKINFKDFDDINMDKNNVNVSEFDSKIHDELCKFSLIDDSEEINHLDVDDMLSSGLLDMREALIDKKINEELSKLSVNYDEISPINLNCNLDLNFRDSGSSIMNSNLINDIDLDPDMDINIVNIDRKFDMSTISPNVFYKSSNDSIETKSKVCDVNSIKDSIIKREYGENDENYSVNSANYKLENNLSSKSDMDIYRELEKLDKISSACIIHNDKLSPTKSPPHQIISSTSSSSSSFTKIGSPTNSIDYSTKLENSFKSLPLKSPCAHSNCKPYEPYDFTISKISPLKTSNNSSASTFSTTSTSFIPHFYDKSSDINFKFNDNTINTCQSYDIDPEKRSVLTKENLEFRVKYDDDQEHKIYDKNHHFSSLLNYPTTDLHLNLDLERDIQSSTYFNSTPITTTTNSITDNTSKILSTKLNFHSDTDKLSPSRIKTPEINYSKKYISTASNDYLYKKSPDNDYDRHHNIYKTEDTNINLDLNSYVQRNNSKSGSNYQFVNHDLTSTYSTTQSFPTMLETASSLNTKPIGYLKENSSSLTYSTNSQSIRECDAYKKNSMNLELIDDIKKTSLTLENKCKTPSPRSQFVSPFPVKNVTRKPKELGLKLGLYLPSTFNQSKRS